MFSLLPVAGEKRNYVNFINFWLKNLWLSLLKMLTKLTDGIPVNFLFSLMYWYSHSCYYISCALFCSFLAFLVPFFLCHKNKNCLSFPFPFPKNPGSFKSNSKDSPPEVILALSGDIGCHAVVSYWYLVVKCQTLYCIWYPPNKELPSAKYQ